MTRNPTLGDPFRLDGFSYLLTTQHRQWNEDGTPRGVVQRYQRPLGATPSHDDPDRLNFNYKRRGRVRQEQLAWHEPADWHAAVIAQLVSIERSLVFGPNLKTWAAGASQATREYYAAAGGCWAMPGRHILKPPMYADKMVVCASVQEAYRVATWVLSNRFYLTPSAALAASLPTKE